MEWIVLIFFFFSYEEYECVNERHLTLKLLTIQMSVVTYVHKLYCKCIHWPAHRLSMVYVGGVYMRIDVNSFRQNLSIDIYNIQNITNGLYHTLTSFLTTKEKSGNRRNKFND